MAARYFGSKLEKTKRYQVGEQLRGITRNLLLLTATPHNGKEEDFQQFLALLDPDRFAGRLRDGRAPDASDLMRRYVKENLLTFDGRPLFPERIARSVKYDLSPMEDGLYKAVTHYVREEMDKAKAIEEGGDRRRGLVVGFALTALQRRLASSPEAIYRSLQRRTGTPPEAAHRAGSDRRWDRSRSVPPSRRASQRLTSRTSTSTTTTTSSSRNSKTRPSTRPQRPRPFPSSGTRSPSWPHWRSSLPPSEHQVPTRSGRSCRRSSSPTR